MKHVHEYGGKTNNVKHFGFMLEPGIEWRLNLNVAGAPNEMTPFCAQTLNTCKAIIRRKQ
jgi:hypothetical protein